MPISMPRVYYRIATYGLAVSVGTTLCTTPIVNGAVASMPAKSHHMKVKQVFSAVLPNASGINESYPVERNGTLYVTTGSDGVVAMNALTGKVKWTYKPTLKKQGAPTNRGVAIGHRRVYLLTSDCRLIALNRLNGKVMFSVIVANTKLGYFESSAPRVAGNEVIVGSSGGDNGVRGFVAAYNAISGKQIWRFYTIPARGQGWVPASGNHGGGAVWTTPTYDVANKAVVFGTGNPSPDYFGQSRPGKDLYTDSVISLNMQTGRLRWYRQEVQHDLWDYDAASPVILFKVDGHEVAGEAGKDGYWYEWSAKTGKPLTKPVAFVKESHSPPTASGTVEWPGPAGGANYGPSAYDRSTHDAYIAGINGPAIVKSANPQHTRGQSDFGTSFQFESQSNWYGTLTAVNTISGKIKWQDRLSVPPIGGVTDDRDGTISLGLSDGTVEIISATTGKRLWSTNVGAPIGSAPTVYKLNGTTYMSLVTGGSADLSLWDSMYPTKGANRVYVYRIPTTKG